jgi:ammonia channel protein AmtB
MDVALRDDKGALTMSWARVLVHGVSGLWGVISVGLLATGRYGASFGAGWNGAPARAEMIGKFGSDGMRGLFYGDASQLRAHLLDVCCACSDSRWPASCFRSPT